MTTADCDRWEELDADYLAGRLAPSEHRAFRHHLATCDRCAERLLLGIDVRASVGTEYATTENENISVNADTLTCDDVTARDLVDRYITGRLEPAEAENFERHYFGCEACWSAVQSAVGVAGDAASTAALRQVSAPPAQGTARRRRLWPLLAAAAIAVIAVTGLYTRMTGPAAEEPAALRGPVDEIAMTVRVANDSLLITWPAVDSTLRYRVRVFNTQGDLMHEAEEPSPRFAWRLPTSEPPADLLVRVQAIDRLGAVLAESDLQRIGDAR